MQIINERIVISYDMQKLPIMIINSFKHYKDDHC